MTDTAVVTPAIDIQVVFGADGNRAFQARFAPLPLDVSAKDLDESLDRVLRALDRQAIFYQLRDLEARLAEQVERLKKYEGMLLTVDEKAQAQWESEGRKGSWTPEQLRPQEKQHRTALQQSLQKDTAEAKVLQGSIDRLRQMVNGHVTYSGANSQSG